MASTTAKGKYPEQLIAMVSAETKAFIRDKAAETDRSISEVARDYLEAGIASAEFAERHIVGPDEVKLDLPVDDGSEWMDETPPRPPKTFY